MTVETYFDNDRSNATVDSILGTANAAACIDKAWTKPFDNTLNTTIFGIKK